MVASDSGSPSTGIGGQGGTFGSSYRLDASDAGTTLSKLRHTLTSGIHGTVTKLSPTRPPSASTHDSGISSSTSSLSSGAAGGISTTSLSSNSTVSFEERSLLQKVWEKAERYEPPETRVLSKPPPISTPTAPVGGTFSPLSPPVNGGQTGEATLGPSKPIRPPGSSCRVCVKTISDSEYFRRCSECNQKVCEDCASYSSAKDGMQDTWHCSICRRRLLSRVKKETAGQKIPNSESGTGLSIPEAGVPTPLVAPTTGTPAGLSLVTGIASMASPLAASTPPTTASTVMTTSKLTAGLSATQVTSAPTSNIEITSNAPTPTTAVVPVTKPSPAPKEEILPNGVPRKESRRPSRSVPQRSIERSTSKEDMKERERRPSTARRGKDIPHREKTTVSRRRSDNEEELHQNKPAIVAARRGHRVSDYMLREPSEDQAPASVTVKTKGETDSLLPANQRQSEAQKPPSGASTDVVGGSGDSSGEEPSADGRRGRRRSIIRQKSCDEEAEDNALLSLWSTGQLPVRRHSAQDPSRKSEHPDFQRSKESLDVPQGRVHRHHSWDYDISRGNHQGHDSLLPNAIPAQCSRFSSESDMSNESTSERGSTVALTDDPLRRANRPPTNRKSSYRPIRGKDDETQLQYNNEEYINTTIPTETAHAGGSALADSTTGAVGSNRRPGTSSLEEDPWLHPAEDEWRSTRRRSSAISDSGRILPTPPASPRIAAYTSSWGSGGSGPAVGRSSQSMESSSSRDMGDEVMARQSSVAEGEAIKIVIHDVDTDFAKGSKMASQKEEGKRRLKIMREMDDTSHRAGGLGMRIVGGKVSSDGSLMASVVWTIPGGPADCAGVRQGDKVIEWNGVNLVNRNFEDVCAIIEADELKEVVEMVIETSAESSGVIDSGRDPREENPLVQAQRGSLEQRGSIDSDLEKSLMCVSRRKLPKIPGDLHRAPVSGKIQVQIWFDKNSSQLITTVLSAHDLRHREGYVPPDAFVSLRLVPHSDCNMYTTPVADPSTKPLWNASFLWESINGDALLGMTLELSVWDFINDAEKGFLGECLIDLRHAYLDERPTWFRLQERRSRSANTTPRGSIAGYDFVMPIVKRPSSVKSGSDEFHDRDDSRHSSIDSGLLHPDLAWRDSRSNSRRGSSVSEHGESEIYQLTRSYPHSLPQSRRSSFAYQTGSPEFRAEELEERLRVIKPPERRRAHSVRVTSQRELLQEAGWKNPNQTPHWLGSSSSIHLGNSSSNISTLTPGTRRGRSNSMIPMGDLKGVKGSSKLQRPEEDLQQTWRTNLGPGQVVPRAYRAILTDDFTLGEIRLELSQTRGHLEVEVSNARGLHEADSGQPPDTYVKTYLKEGDKRMHKRKTRVIRQSKTPNFYQTLRYPTQELVSRTLLVMVWEKTRGFEHNVGLGVAEIAVHKLELRRPVTGWYRLLPVSSVDRIGNSESD